MIYRAKQYMRKRDGSNVNQYLAAISATVALFTVSLHFSWTMPSLPKIMADGHKFQVSEDEASYIAMISSVGHVIGGIGGSFMIDIIGRKNTILSIGFPQILGFLFTYLCYHGTYWLYLARISGGISEGAAICIIPTYVAEVTSPNLRGTIGILSCFAWPLGSLFINLVGSHLDIQDTALICMTFPIIFLTSFCSMPESPYYLLMKKESKKAERSLKMLRRSDNVEKEFFALQADVERQMSEKGRFRDIFLIASNRRAFILVVLLRFFQQATGTTAINSYTQVLIGKSTNLSPVVGACMLIVVQLVMTLVQYLLIERLGRKPLMFISSLLTFVMLVVLSIFFTLNDHDQVDMEGMEWLLLLFMALYVVGFMAGLGGVIIVFISEIFSTSVKSKALGLISIVFAVSSMASIKLYQFTADNVGPAVPFYIFAAVTLIGSLFIKFCLPETKGRSLETIQQQLKKGSMIIKK